MTVLKQVKNCFLNALKDEEKGSTFYFTLPLKAPKKAKTGDFQRQKIKKAKK